MSWQQRLDTHTHHWRAPDPGEIVPAQWDPVNHQLRLDLSGDPRYDKRLIKKLGRTVDGSPGSKWPPVGGGGMGS